MKKYIFLIPAMALLTLPSAVFAQAGLWVICGNLAGCGNPWAEYLSPALTFLGTKLTVYVQIFGGLFVMIGGAYMLVSAGDSERMTKGKNTVMWAVAGIFLAQTTNFVFTAVVAEWGAPIANAPSNDVIAYAGNTMISTISDLFYIVLSGVAIYCGMRMAVTFGKQEEFAKARDGLFYAAIGAILINWANLILSAFTTM